MAPPAHNRWDWSAEEDWLLQQQPPLPAQEAAQQLGRSVTAIHNRRLALRRARVPRTGSAPQLRTCADCDRPFQRPTQRTRCAPCQAVHKRLQARAREAAQQPHRSRTA